MNLMKPKIKYVIKDWTGAIKFHSQEFDTFEEASGHMFSELHRLNPGVTEDEFEAIVGEFHIDRKVVED